jgi:hypothetical protein
MNNNTANHNDLETLRSAILHQADNWAWATRMHKAVLDRGEKAGTGYPLEDWERTVKAAEEGLAKAVDDYAKAYNLYEGRMV